MDGREYHGVANGLVLLTLPGYDRFCLLSIAEQCVERLENENVEIKIDSTVAIEHFQTCDVRTMRMVMQRVMVDRGDGSHGTHGEIQFAVLFRLEPPVAGGLLSVVDEQLPGPNVPASREKDEVVDQLKCRRCSFHTTCTKTRTESIENSVRCIALSRNKMDDVRYVVRSEWLVGDDTLASVALALTTEDDPQQQ